MLFWRDCTVLHFHEAASREKALCGCGFTTCSRVTGHRCRFKLGIKMLVSSLLKKVTAQYSSCGFCFWRSSLVPSPQTSQRSCSLFLSHQSVSSAPSRLVLSLPGNKLDGFGHMIKKNVGLLWHRSTFTTFEIC